MRDTTSDSAKTVQVELTWIDRVAEEGALSHPFQVHLERSGHHLEEPSGSRGALVVHGEVGDIPPAEYEMLNWTESGRTDTVGLTELSLH